MDNSNPQSPLDLKCTRTSHVAERVLGVRFSARILLASIYLIPERQLQRMTVYLSRDCRGNSRKTSIPILHTKGFLETRVVASARILSRNSTHTVNHAEHAALKLANSMHTLPDYTHFSNILRQISRCT